MYQLVTAPKGPGAQCGDTEVKDHEFPFKSVALKLSVQPILVRDVHYGRSLPAGLSPDCTLEPNAQV